MQEALNPGQGVPPNNHQQLATLCNQLQKECTNIQIRTTFLKGKEAGLRKSIEFYKSVLNRIGGTFDIEINQ